LIYEKISPTITNNRQQSPTAKAEWRGHLDWAAGCRPPRQPGWPPLQVAPSPEGYVKDRMAFLRRSYDGQGGHSFVNLARIGSFVTFPGNTVLPTEQPQRGLWPMAFEPTEGRNSGGVEKPCLYPSLFGDD
jgi:hypothetical protein